MTRYARYARLLLVLLILATMSLTSTHSYSQGDNGEIAINEDVTPWAISGDLCSGTTPCIRDIRITENNTLYMPSVDGILAYNPNGSAPILYTMPPGPYYGGSSTDWEPIGDEYILRLLADEVGNYGFFRWDLQTNIVEHIPTG